MEIECWIDKKRICDEYCMAYTDELRCVLIEAIELWIKREEQPATKEE